MRASEALGRVSAAISRHDPGIISRLVQSLLLSVTDTAASSWGALDAVGEIIANSPRQFAAYTPQLYPLFGDRELLPDVLHALIKIIKVKPEAFIKLKYRLIPMLGDPDPRVRGYSSILLGNLGAREAGDGLKNLLGDSSVLEIYEKGVLKKSTVGQLASSALDKL